MALKTPSMVAPMMFTKKVAHGNPEAGAGTATLVP
jgi:hypothetical protein